MTTSKKTSKPMSKAKKTRLTDTITTTRIPLTPQPDDKPSAKVEAPPPKRNPIPLSYAEIEAQILKVDGVQVVFRRPRFDVVFTTGYYKRRHRSNTQVADLARRIRWCAGETEYVIITAEGDLIDSVTALTSTRLLSGIRVK